MTLHVHFGLLSLLGRLSLADSSFPTTLEASRNFRVNSDTWSSSSRTISSISVHLLVASACTRSSRLAFSSASTTWSWSAFSRLIDSRTWFCNASTWPFKRPTSRSCSSCALSRRPAASAATVFEASSSETSFSSALSALRDPSQRMRAMRAALSASRTARAAGWDGTPLSTNNASRSERGSFAAASLSCVSQASQSELADCSCRSARRTFNSSRALSSPARPSFSSCQ
mmetsp:Transcript_82088/g.227638  ORF Transcript_82088/g.227638 Transcript_82088/m.227638 type:complete len:229 (-) Transcript_82088:363-1049(-)